MKKELRELKQQYADGISLVERVKKELESVKKIRQHALNELGTALFGVKVGAPVTISKKFRNVKGTVSDYEQYLDSKIAIRISMGKGGIAFLGHGETKVLQSITDKDGNTTTKEIDCTDKKWKE